MYAVIKDALIERGWEIYSEAKENKYGELREFLPPTNWMPEKFRARFTLDEALDYQMEWDLKER